MSETFGDAVRFRNPGGREACPARSARTQVLNDFGKEHEYVAVRWQLKSLKVQTDTLCWWANAAAILVASSLIQAI